MNVGRVVKHAFLCENNPPLAVCRHVAYPVAAAYPTRKALGMVMPPYVLKGSLNF